MEDFYRFFLSTYLILFGILEARNLNEFRRFFERYDPLSYWFPWYSTLYPFISIVFGLMMFIDYFVFLLAIVLVVMFASQAYGIWKIMKSEPKVPHINMGPKYKMPLSKLILVESGVIVLLSLLILF